MGVLQKAEQFLSYGDIFFLMFSMLFEFGCFVKNLVAVNHHLQYPQHKEAQMLHNELQGIQMFFS